MYNYNFEYDIPDFSSGTYNSVSSGVAGVVLAVLVVFAIFAFAFAIVSYVFESLAWYKIAKKRNINNPWLAWIPYAGGFLIGKIGDYYYDREIGKNYHFSIWIICLLAGGTIAPFTIFLIFLAPLALIAASVLEYICLYKFFKNVTPDNAVLLIVLCIIFPIAMPFILFAHRNKPDVIPANAPTQTGQPYYNQAPDPYQQYAQQYPAPQAPVQQTFEQQPSAPVQPQPAQPQQPPENLNQ